MRSLLFYILFLFHYQYDDEYGGTAVVVNVSIASESPQTRPGRRPSPNFSDKLLAYHVM